MNTDKVKSFSYLADYISTYVSDNSDNLSHTEVISVSTLDRMHIDKIFKYFKDKSSSIISQFKVSTGIDLYYRSNRS